ncbi:MAG: hypothetical protein KTR35_03450 [Gammaproteobacteria bacterium]|nr:hypothetical protein [Gammaproteobacteria bacterium]
MDVLVLVAGPALLFVFLSETLNPFGEPEERFLKPRWNLARLCAFIMLIVGMGSWWVSTGELTMQIILTLAGTALLCIPAILRYYWVHVRKKMAPH